MKWIDHENGAIILGSTMQGCRDTVAGNMRPMRGVYMKAEMRKTIKLHIRKRRADVLSSRERTVRT